MPKEHYLMRRMIARQTKEKVEEKMKSCFMELKAAATDIRYFARSKFS